tara:strand:- start:11830 stop:12063 length:234 start_codon:yes stop_codon:yes gene_type:complete
MSDESIITLEDGSKWRPSTSADSVSCALCPNVVDTPAEIASWPEGNCPDCGNPWTGNEKRSTVISVTVPESIGGGVG